MIESASLALLPLIAGTLVLAARFYIREGATSIFSLTFILAALCVGGLLLYMLLTVLAWLPPYAWVGFGGFGLAMALGGIWTFNR